MPHVKLEKLARLLTDAERNSAVLSNRERTIIASAIREAFTAATNRGIDLERT